MYLNMLHLLVERKFLHNFYITIELLIDTFDVFFFFSFLSRYGVQAAIKTRGKREAGTNPSS